MKSVISLFVFLVMSVAQAQEFALTAGLRNNNADTDLALGAVEAQTSFYVGGLAYFPMIHQLTFRTGFLYTQRYADIIYVNGTSDEVRFSYLDIPLTLMMKFSDYAGVFAGPVVSINHAKDCSRSSGGVCTATNAKSSIIPIVIGASFKFAPQMGGEFFYEWYSGELASGISNMRSLGANFVFYFE